ncbi:MAG: UDP-2,4-diacetamido-2,4,6-trideoxy-beta-L-altropyranose hydrolase [Lachnospiraceae bacterium]|nr:UDP-2,4-diacetamido-2,4,6-trideoxy-beta-L-altropyranose hydrolase [Lachnospiraceae bacterium]
MIWIRADANKKIGAGHVMRCMTIAKALKRLGREVCFLVSDDSAVELLEANGQNYRVLNVDYTNLCEELPIITSLLEKEQPKLCLVDSYYATADYLEKLGEHTKVVYMDDLGSFSYPADVMINYNIFAEQLPYLQNAARTDMQFLLGLSYAPLRDEFCAHSIKTIRDKAEKVLITTGGSDQYNLAGRLLIEFMRLEDTRCLEYHVVCGAFNENRELLERMQMQYPQIHIHCNVKNMAELMQQCDVAITAAGATVYELCAVGIPFICFSFAENQEKQVEALVAKEMICFGGNYLDKKEALFDDIAQNLNRLIHNKRAREAYSIKERQLVDGQGAMRIAQTLCDLGNR